MGNYNSNNITNNAEGQKQPRKRKLNELANDDDDQGQPATVEEQKQQPTPVKKREQHGKGTVNDLLGEWDDPDSPNDLVRFFEKQVNLNLFL
jgi:hypothetical protein